MYENAVDTVFLNTDIIDFSDTDSLEKAIYLNADRKIDKTRKGFIYNLIAACPALVEVVNGLKTSEQLKLVLNDDVKEAIASGVYKLMGKNDAAGMFKAIVVNQAGKIQNIPDLKIEKVCTGVDPAQIASAIQGMAIQQQLQDIAEQLEMMTMALNDVLAGQHNDRLAKYYAGVSLYKEAFCLKNEILRQQLVNSAILMLSGAYSELGVSLRYDINRICDFYDPKTNAFKKIKVNQLIADMEKVNQSFEAIHKTVSLKTAMYYNEGEYDACTMVLSEYGSFLKKVLTDGKAEILYQADPNAKAYIGVWNDREDVLPKKIEQVKEKLRNRDDLFIEITKGDLVWNTNAQDVRQKYMG